MPGGQRFQDNLVLVIGAEYSNALKAMEQIEERVDAMAKHISASGAAAKTAAQAQDKMTSSTNKAAKAQDKMSTSTKRAATSQAKINSSLIQTSHSMRRMTASLSTGNLSLDTLSLRLDRASMFMWRFNIAMIPLQQIEFQIAALTTGVVMLERAAVNAYRSAERMKNTFIGMGDSASEAGDKVDFLLEKAKSLPFTFTEVSGAAMAFRTSGLAKSTEELERWLDAAADLAAASTTEAGHNIATAAEAMVDAVNGEIRRLRNTYHVSMEEIQKYGDDTKSALFSLIEAKWGGTAEKQMASLEGAISNFVDSLTRLGIAFGENLAEPLSALLGIGGKIIDWLTDVTKLLGSVGGTAAMAGVGVGILIIAGTRLMMIWMQIKSMSGAVLILTRNMGSLFTVMAQMTEAMNRLAIQEADEITRTNALSGALANQLKIRQALSKTIGGQIAAGAAENMSQGYWGAARKFGPPPNTGVSGQMIYSPMDKQLFGVGGYESLGKNVTGLADAIARDVGAPMKLFEEYARRTGRVVSELTKQEVMSLTETAKRIGILEVETNATRESTAANAAKAASEQRLADNIAKNILLRKKFEQYSIGNVFGGITGALGGGARGLMDMFTSNKLRAAIVALQGKFLDMRLALNSTAGAAGALTAATLSVGWAYSKISNDIRKTYSELDELVSEHLGDIEQRENLKQISSTQADIARQRLQALKEEEALLIRQRNILAGLSLLIVTLPITLPLLGKNEEMLMEIEAKMQGAYDTGIREEAFRRFEKGQGAARFMGRSTTYEEVLGEKGALTRINRYDVRGNIQHTEFSKQLEEAEALVQYYKELDEKGIDVTDELTAATIRYNTMLEQEARDRRAIAIIQRDQQGLQEAEQDILLAIQGARQALIESLGKQINEADSHLGYLREIGASTDELSDVMLEQVKIHLQLADAYKKSGDMARYWQEMTAANKMAVEAATADAKKQVDSIQREIDRYTALGASADVIYDIMMDQVSALRELADKYDEVGKTEDAEAARIEAITKERQAYIGVLQQEASIMSAYAARADILAADDRGVLDPNVYNARMRAARAELELAKYQRDPAGIISAENRLLQIQRDRVDAAEKLREERINSIRDAQDAFYQWSTVAASNNLITQDQADFIRNRYMQVLAQRIRGEQDVAERIKMQTELIRLQSQEAEDGYDNIIRRIIGGPEAVEQAISTQMLARRFGPRDVGAASFRVIGRDRNTLTIELGPNTSARLRGALSGAASEAFIRSFIEELVVRLRG